MNDSRPSRYEAPREHNQPEPQQPEQPAGGATEDRVTRNQSTRHRPC
jgi:hypothetical protein